MDVFSHISSAFGVRKIYINIAQFGASVDNIDRLVSSSCVVVYKVIPELLILRERDECHFIVYVVRIDGLSVPL